MFEAPVLQHEVNDKIDILVNEKFDKMSLNREHRLRCLDAAITINKNGCVPTEQIIADATKLYEFATSSKTLEKPNKRKGK